jgi:hypothetical protein
VRAGAVIHPSVLLYGDAEPQLARSFFTSASTSTSTSSGQSSVAVQSAAPGGMPPREAAIDVTVRSSSQY